MFFIVRKVKRLIVLGLILIVAVVVSGSFVPQVKCAWVSLGLPNIFPGYSYGSRPEFKECLSDHKKLKRYYNFVENEQERLERLKEEYEKKKSLLK